MSFRNSAGVSGEKGSGGPEVARDLFHASAFGRDDGNVDASSSWAAAPSNQRVGSSNLSGRARSDAISDDTARDDVAGDTGFLPARTPRGCVDGELVRAAYTAVRLKRAPRGFLVFGERSSIVWPGLALLAWVGIAAATAQQEREAATEQRALIEREAFAEELAERALGDELECEAVLASCVAVVGNGLGCSCFVPEDVTP